MDLTDTTSAPAADTTPAGAAPAPSSGPASINDLLGTPAPAAAPAASADGNAAPGAGGDVPADFLALFSSETPEGETASVQDWIKASGIKDVASLAKIARDNQRALRESGRFKVPGEGATDQEIAEFRQAIGVPAKPEDYARPEFRDANGNPIEYNTELTEAVFAKMHAAGVPKTAAEAVMKSVIEEQLAEYDAAIKDIQAKANAHVQAWGPEREAKMAQVNAALKELGFDRADVDHMRALPGGVGKFLDAMAKIGTNFTEASLIQGDRRTFGLSADQAQAELASMKADKATLDKMMIPGSAENLRYNRLLEQIAAAADRQPVDI